MAETLSQRTPEGQRMSPIQEIQKRKQELKARRKPLFDWYLKNPDDTTLVLEIRIVDDEIAKCNEQMERARVNRVSEQVHA